MSNPGSRLSKLLTGEVTMSLEGYLRAFSLGCVAIATPLNIATSVLSMEQHSYWRPGSSLTVFPFMFIPLAVSAIISAGSFIHKRRRGHMPGAKYAPADAIALVFWLVILLCTWTIEIGRLDGSGLGLLAGYTTAPMIGLMIVHALLFSTNIRSFWSSFGQSSKMHVCPNCHSNVILGAANVQETASREGANYSLLRGEDYLDTDQDAVPYTDGRNSDEQMHREVEGKNVGGKGKVTLDV